MLTKTKNRIKRLNIFLTMCIFILAGASFVHADKTPADKALKLKVGNFRMHLGVELKESILQEVTAEDRANKVVELGNWPHAPMEVAAVRLQQK